MKSSLAYRILAASLLPLVGCSNGTMMNGSAMVQAAVNGISNQMSPNTQSQPAQTNGINAVTPTPPPTADPQPGTDAAQQASTILPIVQATANQNPGKQSAQANANMGLNIFNSLAGQTAPTTAPATDTNTAANAFGQIMNQAGQVNANQPGQSSHGKKNNGAKSAPGAKKQVAVVAPAPRAAPANLIAPKPKTASAVTTTPPLVAKPGQPTAVATPPAKPAVATPAVAKPAVAKTTPPKLPPKKTVTPVKSQPRAPRLVPRPRPGVNGVIGTSPDDGSTEMDLANQLLKSLTLSEKDEDALGQSVGISLTNQYPVTQKEALKKYVSLVGLTVASAGPRPDIEYVFGVLDTPEINAFSGPNGYIFITTGALAHMQDEAELAGVLAHEISHVVLEHGLAQVKASANQAALHDAMKLATHDSNLTAFGDMAVDSITKLGYTQQQEFDADTSAVVIMAAAGYNPQSYLHFLQRMVPLQKQQGTAMSTHPGADQRVDKVSAQIQGAPELQTGATLPDRFGATVKL